MKTRVEKEWEDLQKELQALQGVRHIAEQNLLKNHKNMTTSQIQFAKRDLDKINKRIANVVRMIERRGQGWLF